MAEDHLILVAGTTEDVTTELSELPDESAACLASATSLGFDLEAVSEQSIAAPRLLPRLLRWGKIVSEYGAVQVAVQLTGAVAGFIIVRSLAKPEYALYAVANAGLAMFNILADTGISPALRSIGGEVHAERTTFSELVVTALQLRRWYAGFALLLSMPVMVWMLLSNGASFMQTVALCTAVLAASWPLLTATVLRETALMLGKYRKVQVAEFTTSAVRLTCTVAAFSWLTSFLGIAFAAVANWVQLAFYRRHSSDDVDLSAPTNKTHRKRVLAITKRMLPNVLFFCFQGQVTFILLTVLGTTTGLADVAALGRLAALLAIFSAVFNNVLAPRFARCQDATRLPGLYLGLALLAAACLAPAVLVAWLFPELLLMILGDAYRGLEWECFLMVLAGCLAQFGGIIAWLNFSRNWIRWYTYLNIPVILGAQIAGILLFDVGTVGGVLLFSIASALAPIPVYLADSWHGLRAFEASQTAAIP